MMNNNPMMIENYNNNNMNMIIYYDSKYTNDEYGFNGLYEYVTNK